MRMQDVMEKARTISEDSSVEEALALSGKAFVVVAGKRVLGVVSDRDLRAVPEVSRSSATVRAALQAIPPLAPHDTVKDAANVLRSHAAECVPVIEHEKLVGMFSVARLLELVGRGALHPQPRSEHLILRSRGQRPHRSGV